MLIKDEEEELFTNGFEFNSNAWPEFGPSKTFQFVFPSRLKLLTWPDFAISLFQSLFLFHFPQSRLWNHPSMTSHTFGNAPTPQPLVSHLCTKVLVQATLVTRWNVHF